jgi:hypothetical protein
MFRSLWQAMALTLVSTAITNAAGPKVEPIGAPPQFGIVTQANGKGAIEFRYYSSHFPLESTDLPQQPVMQEAVRRSDLSNPRDIRILDLNGKVLNANDAIKRLTNGTVILVSSDG